MSRVEEEREAQRYEDRRRQEEVDKTKRQESNEAFKKQLSQQQSQKQMGSPQNRAAQSQTQNRGNNANAALLAKQGIQSHAFNKMLEQRGFKSGEEVKTEGKSRGGDAEENRRVSDERKSDIERKLEQREEHNAPISRDDERKGGGFGGSSGESDSSSNSGGDGSSGQNKLGMGQQLSQTEAQSSHRTGPTTTLSTEQLRSLVGELLVGVNAQGFGECHIILNQGPLAGTRLQMTCENRNLTITMHVKRDEIRGLLQRSHRALAQALSDRGFNLKHLAVERA